MSCGVWPIAKAAIAGVLVAATLVVAACSNPLEDAETAFLRGDYETAIRLIRPRADLGDADAQFALGVLYMRGLGVPENPSEAVQWYRKAADQGKVEAQTNLGLMYSEGLGVAKDYAGALKWFRLAAEAGDPDAQHNLGLAYELGQGVEADVVQAHAWYSLAASRYSDSDQQRRLEQEKAYGAHSIQSRDELAAKMTSAQIAEAEKLAREWKLKTKRP